MNPLSAARSISAGSMSSVRYSVIRGSKADPARQRGADAVPVAARERNGRDRRLQVRHHDRARELPCAHAGDGREFPAVPQVQVPVVRARHRQRRNRARQGDSILTRGHRRQDHIGPAAGMGDCRRSIMADGPQTDDIDPLETTEWLESIDSVLKTHGPVRAHFLLDRLIDHARRSGAWLPFKANTAYVNTIHVSREKPLSGRPRDRAAHRVADPLERGRDGRAREPGQQRVRRPHRDLCLVRDALRSRLQSFLARAVR